MNWVTDFNEEECELKAEYYADSLYKDYECYKVFKGSTPLSPMVDGKNSADAIRNYCKCTGESPNGLTAYVNGDIVAGKVNPYEKHK